MTGFYDINEIFSAFAEKRGFGDKGQPVAIRWENGLLCVTVRRPAERQPHALTILSGPHAGWLVGVQMTNVDMTFQDYPKGWRLVWESWAIRV
jgi:hypothetical protein